MKIHPAGVELSHADGRTTDIMKLVVFFKMLLTHLKKRNNVNLRGVKKKMRPYYVQL